SSLLIFPARRSSDLCCCPSSRAHRIQPRLLCVIVRHSRSLPIRSAERIPPDGPINCDAIASRDSRPEEGASRTQRVHALALLPGERSPAHVLRWGIPRGIPQLNRQPPNDRKDSLLERGSQ